MSIYNHLPRREDAFLSRRQMLQRCGMGMGSLGLAGLMGSTGLLTATARGQGTASAAAAAAMTNPLAPKMPPFAARAKRVIHIFCNGGPSHVDLFDPKPELAKYAGKPLPTGRSLRTERKTGGAFPTPFKFNRCGQSGLELSELLPTIGKSADELCVIRSMKAEIPSHEPSLMMMNCGEQQLARPSVGAWVMYGLGTENENLPGFIAMCPGGYPIKETDNWTSAFLPGVYQGTYVDSQHTSIDKLIENIRNPRVSSAAQSRQLELLRELNAEHHAPRGFDPQLDARIQSFELAYRMQMEAADAFDIGKEPEAVRQAYGEHVHGRQTLIARRLLERGVRFVQLWHGAGQPWDTHSDIKGALPRLSKEIDQPVGALLIDLKQRGMLDDTLVLFGGEFGRTPVTEGDSGRDHNPFGFSVFLAGGGVKGGMAYGATDEFGFAATENVCHVHDLHATMLHLLGFDHEKFTYRYAGRDFRLTDVHGHVAHDVIA
jgi:hypothetical protein